MTVKNTLKHKRLSSRIYLYIHVHVVISRELKRVASKYIFSYLVMIFLDITVTGTSYS